MLRVSAASIFRRRQKGEEICLVRPNGSRYGRWRFDDGIDEARAVLRSQALDANPNDRHTLFPPLLLGDFSAIAIELGVPFDLKVEITSPWQELIHLRMIDYILGELHHQLLVYFRESSRIHHGSISAKKRTL
jgi:hypothetical protein